jgi:hypothetical protein
MNFHDKNRVKHETGTFITAKQNDISSIETTKCRFGGLLTKYVSEPITEHERISILWTVRLTARQMYVAGLLCSFGKILQNLKVKLWEVKILWAKGLSAANKSAHLALRFPLAPERHRAPGGHLQRIPGPCTISEEEFPFMVAAIPILPTQAPIPSVCPVFRARVNKLNDAPHAHAKPPSRSILNCG